MAEKRRALIVAIYKYQDPDLRQLVAPAQDAEALARVLQDPAIGGFQVQTLLNKPSYKVNQAIEAFFANRKPNDLLLLYYSGHGIKDEDGRLYFAATDTRRKMLRTTAIPTTLVNDVMRYSRSRRQVLLMDCCYSGAFARGMIAKAGADIGVKEHFGGRGRVVLTASDAIQYAFEGDGVIGEGSHSVFTRHLVQGLETGEADLDDDGWISLDELYDYVYDRVTGEAPQQTPRKWVFDLQGEIHIARNPHWVIKPAELPLELQRATESPFAGLREGAVSELEQLLHGGDESLSLAARQALERLTDDDSRRVSTVAVRALRAVTTLPTDRPALSLPTSVIQEQEKPARRPAPAAPQARGQLRRLLSSVPAWVWAVVGVAAVGLLIAWGSLADWGGATMQPTPMPTQAPTDQPAIEPTLAIPTPTPTMELPLASGTPPSTSTPTKTPTATRSPTSIPTSTSFPPTVETIVQPTATSVVVGGGATINLASIPATFTGAVSESQSASYILENNSDSKTIMLTMSSNGTASQCVVHFWSDSLIVPGHPLYEFLQTASSTVTRSVIAPSGTHTLSVSFLNYDGYACPSTLSYTLTVSP